MRILNTFIFLFTINLFIVAQTPSGISSTNQRYLVSFDTENQITQAKEKGAIITIHPNQTATLTIPKSSPWCINDFAFKQVQIPRKTKPQLERARVDVKASKLQDQLNGARGFTGKGVIIGITDWGFDYSHPMFYDTTLTNSRIIAAWDQYKLSGPSPNSFDYGTEYQFPNDLESFPADTFNIYQMGTHGTHVAGIAGGSGAGTKHRGIAPEAEFLFCTFLVDEAAFIDGVKWMKEKADELNKRLVINMSWGLYDLGPLDGTSILSQALNGYSDQGVVFVTSAGNNGEDPCHIRKSFNSDTMTTLVNFYPYSAHPQMWGQGLHIWGEKDHSFKSRIVVVDGNNRPIAGGPVFEPSSTQTHEEGHILVDSDTIKYRLSHHVSHDLNGRPWTRIIVNNQQGNHRIALRVYAQDGIIDIWNITYLNNQVGNWGMPLSAPVASWTAGDASFTLGEPASTEEVITVGAYTSEFTLFNGEKIGGQLAPFSSVGPTQDLRQKPDISAPGVSVVSSVSSFTNRSFNEAFNVTFNNKQYPFARFSGTSMSSPVVTGIVALMLEANPQLSPKQIKSILKETARSDEHTSDTVSNGSVHWGFGKADAEASVNLALQTKGVQTPLTFNFFPNPAVDYIEVEGEIEKLALYNLNGQLLELINQPQQINISHLPCGVYLIKNVEENQTKKLVISR